VSRRRGHSFWRRVAQAVPAALLAGALAPSLADAAGPCPRWRDRTTLDCMRAYLRIDPAGLRLTLAEDPKSELFSEQRAVGDGKVAYDLNFGAGYFRTFGRFGLAVGAHLGRGVYGRSSTYEGSIIRTRERYFSFGPELRLGGAFRHVFVYGLLRVGGTHWTYLPRRPVDKYPETALTWHVAAGAGVWGQLARRLLIGGEALVEVMGQRLPYHAEKNFVTFGMLLSLGVFL
jgi:hypothetical protein